MRYLLLFLGGVVLGAVSMAAGTWTTQNQTQRPTTKNESFSDQFFRQALALGNSEDWPSQRKQDLLRQAAARRQEQDVAASELYWKEFQKELGAGHADGVDPTATVRQLLEFQSHLESALGGAANVTDFEHAWGTWQKVNEQLAVARNELVARLAGKVGELPEPGASESLAEFTDKLQRLATALRTVQPEITALLAATPPAEPVPDPVAHITALAKKYQARSLAVVRQAEAELNSRRQRLHDGAVKIDPSTSERNSVADSSCTTRLNDLIQLDAAIQGADFASWIALEAGLPEAGDRERTTGDTANESEALSSAILAAQQLANSTCRLAYNLWALREIHAAESVESWPGRLGRIDNGMLEPVVAALFASTYSRRIEEIKDPERRSTTVQTILTGTKIPLTAF